MPYTCIKWNTQCAWRSTQATVRPWEVLQFRWTIKSRIVVKDTPADNALSDSTQQKWDSYFNHGVVISLAGLLPVTHIHWLSYTSPTLSLLLPHWVYFSHTEFTSPTLCFTSPTLCFTSLTLSLLLPWMHVCHGYVVCLQSNGCSCRSLKSDG